MQHLTQSDCQSIAGGITPVVSMDVSNLKPEETSAFVGMVFGGLGVVAGIAAGASNGTKGMIGGGLLGGAIGAFVATPALILTEHLLIAAYKKMGLV